MACFELTWLDSFEASGFSPIINSRASAVRANGFRRARRAWRRSRQFFESRSEFLAYKQVLGWGGFGVVQQWRVMEGRIGSARERDVAVKFPSRLDGHPKAERSRAASRREIVWLRNFAGSEHIVQLATFGESIFPRELYNNAILDDPIIVVEYLRRGTLEDLIHRVVRAADPLIPAWQEQLQFIPCRILWRIFLCLARACIALAYPVPGPVAYQHRETIPTVAPPIFPRDIVHSDIDPSNSGRFGLTFEVDPNWTDEEKVEKLGGGKVRYVATEQRYYDRRLEPNAFGPTMNIWGIGITMFNLLTLSHPKDGWQLRDRLIILPSGPFRFLTWGWYLVDSSLPSDIPPEIVPIESRLRHLVARCMADLQVERPKLHELVAEIEQAIRDGDRAAVVEREALANAGTPTPPISTFRRPAVESDALVESFRREYLLEPVPPGDAYSGVWGRATPASVSASSVFMTV
ncbi:Uu.00g013380.m01.CDS01 [Anthostomella pinea]|uniref:Uu.00g013380.m01.CDS01 n=1 Tax=Anthostomella pinea TaxID=933095 RepID=A0AAI8YQ60_9PEZI|nr:Uu.00g013380.m01.CDS01 [Anthostomella pinea]